MDKSFPTTFLELVTRRPSRPEVTPVIVLAYALPIAFGVLMAIADMVRR